MGEQWNCSFIYLDHLRNNLHWCVSSLGHNSSYADFWIIPKFIVNDETLDSVMLLGRLNFYHAVTWPKSNWKFCIISSGWWLKTSVNKEIFRWGNYLGIFFNVDFVSESTTWHNLQNYSINRSEESLPNVNTVEKFTATKTQRTKVPQLSKLMEFLISL